MSNKWVEVEAKTIDDAIKAGLKELQLDDATEADISILREPEGGVFGVGGTKALVRISVRGGFKNRNGRNYKQRSRNDRPKNRKEKFEPKRPRVEADPKKQLEVSISFLQGLIKSFGLEGTVDGETELPEPPPPVKEPIKKDIPIEPPRPITPISPKSKETSPKFPTMPKITPSTPINDPKKIRLQELAGIRKRK